MSKPGHAAPSGSRRPRLRRGVVAAAVVTLLASSVAVARPDLVRTAGDRLPWVSAAQAADDCPRSTVRVLVVPEVLAVTQAMLGTANGTRLSDGRCLQVDVSTEAPVDVVTRTTQDPSYTPPHLWIPDSSLWTVRVKAWKTVPVGRLGSSRVVLATSRATVSRLGWGAVPPTWQQALAGERPITIPRLVDNAAGVAGLLALRESLGKTEQADQAVAAAVLSSGRSRSTAQEALDAAVAGAADAPLLLTSELTVFTTNRGQTSPRLVAVYPEGGAAALDYPVLQIPAAITSTSTKLAVQQVQRVLATAAARAAARSSGLREAAPATGRQVRPLPTQAELTEFLQGIAALATPSRLLVVIDVSTSMRAMVPGTPINRITLATLAAAGAGNLLPDAASVGLWRFAARLDGAKPYQQLSPVAGLDTPVRRATQRDVINQQLAAMPAELSPNGTALYAVSLAAVRQLRRAYDPGAVNTVVLMTDGKNERDASISLAKVLQALRVDRAANPGAPLSMLAIGIGPAADMGALRQIARSTGGEAYRADTPGQLKTIMFRTLAARSPTNG